MTWWPGSLGTMACSVLEDGNGSGGERQRLLTMWKALSADYARVRQELRAAPDARRAAELLHQLSGQRADLEWLNRRLHALVPEAATEHDPAVGSDEDRASLLRPAREGAGIVTTRADAGPRLILRFLIEGPARIDAPGVVADLAQQFRSESAVARSVSGLCLIEWYAFQAGIFEGEPIGFEVLTYDGAVDRVLRRRLRSLVDGVIAVVDPRPDELPASFRFVSEVLDDVQHQPPGERPGLTVFSLFADDPDALHPDLLAAELLVGSSVTIVPTAQDQRGFLYGFAQATGAAIRRVEERDRSALPRRRSEPCTVLLDALDRRFDLPARRVGRSRAAQPPAARAATRPRPDAPVPAQPPPPVAAERPATVGPATEPPPPPGPGAAPPGPSAGPAVPGAGPAVPAAGRPDQGAAPANAVPAGRATMPGGERGRRASGLRRLIAALRTPPDRP
ncbi:MAG: hypothetical protein R2761_30140 [Acidimicrobiales bacterium]